MKFILLVHHDERVLDELGEDALQQLRDESVQLAHQIDLTGKYLDAGPLHRISTATCVQVRDGKRLVMDGPFAETREHLGGYFFIDATDLDDALGIAAEFRGRASALSKSGGLWKSQRRRRIRMGSRYDLNRISIIFFNQGSRRKHCGKSIHTRRVEYNRC